MSLSTIFQLYHGSQLTKSLKIQKGLSEVVRGDNTMAKIKKPRRQTMHNKTLHRKLKIEQQELNK
jgi:hypothetical protein